MNSQELRKTALDHCLITRAVIQSSDKLDEDFLVIGGTSDNEASASLDLDQFLDFNGSMRFVCHSIALATNDAIKRNEALTKSIQRISDLASYTDFHPRISSQIALEQCKIHSRDRLVRLQKHCPTRWHSKLNVIERFVIMPLIMVKVFPSNSLAISTEYEEEELSEYIIVLR